MSGTDAAFEVCQYASGEALSRYDRIRYGLRTSGGVVYHSHLSSFRKAPSVLGLGLSALLEKPKGGLSYCRTHESGQKHQDECVTRFSVEHGSTFEIVRKCSRSSGLRAWAFEALTSSPIEIKRFSYGQR
jgi:hypothetical protein